jgi:hypothetical protein
MQLKFNTLPGKTTYQPNRFLPLFPILKRHKQNNNYNNNNNNKIKDNKTPNYYNRDQYFSRKE